MQTQSKKFGKTIEVKTFFKPGEYLDDIQMKALYKDLVQINQAKETPLQHKLILENRSIDEIKEIYASILVAIIFVQDEAVGFLLTPILAESPQPIAHGGLTVIAKNCGINLLGLLTLCNANVLYERYSRIYVTNISSTPSIIEASAKFSRKVWPDPDADLIKPPRAYREVFDTLINKYVLKFFEDPETVVADRKRFVIRSNSRKMGFNTNMRELSRSVKYKYLSFCFTWLDYELEEDLVQVGVVDWLVGLRNKAMLFYLKYWFFPMKGRKLVRPSKTIPMPLEQTMSKSKKVESIKQASRVRGELPPSSHRTVRTGPYTALHVNQAR